MLRQRMSKRYTRKRRCCRRSKYRKEEYNIGGVSISLVLVYLVLALYPEITLDQAEKIVGDQEKFFSLLRKAAVKPFSRRRFAKVLTLLGYRRQRNSEIFIGEKRKLSYHGRFVERIIPWSKRRSKVDTERAWEDVQHFFWNEYGIEISKEKRPMVEGRHISLAALVLEILRKELGFSQPLFTLDRSLSSDEKDRLKRISSFKDLASSGIFDDFIEFGRVGKDFLQTLFIDVKGIHPPKVILRALAEWLRKLLSRESSQIVSVICPDYSVGEAGEYTFENLGTGVGKVAGKILSTYPMLIEFFKRYGLLENIQFIMLIADTEADLGWNVRRLRISKEEFLRRIEKSLQRIRQRIPVEIQDRFYAMNLTDVAGKGSWSQIFRQALDYAKGDIVAPKESEQESRFLQDLIEGGISETAYSKRLGLYQRWCVVDGNFDKDLADELFIHQKAEHMTSARIITQTYNNPFIIQGESPWLSIWWQFLISRILPVIYLE